MHSPTALTPQLAEQMAALGKVAFLVAPNKIHYWWILAWSVAFPSAKVLKELLHRAVRFSGCVCELALKQLFVIFFGKIIQKNGKK
ncbi:MAG: hypothetical protein AAF471_07665 [Myxococcota bacterium]